MVFRRSAGGYASLVAYAARQTAGSEPTGRAAQIPARRFACRPQPVRDLAQHLPKAHWKRYTIQEGGKGPVVAEFAFLRVTMVRDELPGERVWLVIRKNFGVEPDVKFYVSNAPLTCALRDLVRLSGWRWPVETVLEEGKGEVGMDHYETRTWVGWYHHMAHVFLAHLFLVRQLLQFNKNSRADDRPSMSVGSQCVGRRSLGAYPDDCDYSVPSMSQSRRLPFTLRTRSQPPPLNYLGVN